MQDVSWCRCLKGLVLRACRGIKYGFTITVLEGPATIPTLWQHTRGFMHRNAALIPENNMMEFVTGRDGEYNMCHFWSNFELGDLRFFRSQVQPDADRWTAAVLLGPGCSRQGRRIRCEVLESVGRTSRVPIRLFIIMDGNLHRT